MTEIKKYNMLIVMLIISSGITAGVNKLLIGGGSASYIYAIVCTIAALVVYPMLFSHRAMVSFAHADGVFKKIAAVAATMVFMIYISSFTAYFVEYIRSMFFKKSPFWYIMIFLLVPSTFGCYFGVKSASRYAGVAAAFSIAVIFIILIFCGREYNADNLYPIFGNGVGNMAAGLKNISYFGAVAFYYLLVSHSNCKMSAVKANVAKIVVISGVVIAVVCLCTNLLLPYNAAQLTEKPLYTLAASIRGNYLIERSEAIVLILWIFAAFVCISGGTAVTTEFASKAFKLSNRNALTGCVLAVVYTAAMIFYKYNAVGYMFDIGNYMLGVFSILMPAVINAAFYFSRGKKQ